VTDSPQSWKKISGLRSAVENPYHILEKAIDVSALVSGHPVLPFEGAFAHGFAVLAFDPLKHQATVTYEASQQQYGWRCSAKGG
jgi:hypothetical protein